MIKAQDLRIGNWVKVNGAGTFWANGNKIDHFDSHQINFEGNCAAFIGDCSGIPLTEDLLLKCGFVKCSCGGWKNKIHISGSFVFDRLEALKVKVTSLHQLQNLYFALTGTELNVQL